MADVVMEGNQPQPKGPGLIDKCKLILREARDDYLLTNRVGKIILGSMVAMTTYEWGPGNETMTPIIAGQSIEHANGPAGIALAATITSGFIYTQQRISGELARKTAEQFPNTARKTYSIMQNNEKSDRFKRFADLSWKKKLFYAFSFGSSFNVMREAFMTDDKSKENLSTVAHRSSLITSGVVSGIVAVGGSIDNYVEYRPVEIGMDVIKNPLPWLAFGCVTIAYETVKNKLGNRQQVV